MRIVVTGASGLIGRQLVAELVADEREHEREFELALLGRDADHLARVFAATDHDLVETDYAGDLDHLVAGADALVHLAASVHDPQLSFADFLRLNVQPTRRLFESAADLGVTNVVFASSRTVYDTRTNEVPFTEDQPCDPRLPYGRAKLLSELVAEELNDTAEMRIKCLRIGQVFAADRSHGATIERMIAQAQKKQTLQVWGEGRTARDYVYVKDVTAAIRAALDHPDVGGVFNVSGGVAVSYLELAETINDVFGNAGNLEHRSDESEPESTQFLSCARAAAVLGWSPQWSLRRALADLIG